MNAEACLHIEAVAGEIAQLMDEAFAAVDYRPQPGSSLDQAALLDGERVVNDYLSHGEPGLALDHLLYMVEEPPLPVSRSGYEHLRAAATLMGVSIARLDSTRPTGE